MSSVQLPETYEKVMWGAAIIAAIAIVVGIVAKHPLGKVGGPACLWGGVGVLAVDLIIACVKWRSGRYEQWVVTRDSKGKPVWVKWTSKIQFQLPQNSYMIVWMQDDKHKWGMMAYINLNGSPGIEHFDQERLKGLLQFFPGVASRGDLGPREDQLQGAVASAAASPTEEVAGDKSQAAVASAAAAPAAAAPAAAAPVAAAIPNFPHKELHLVTRIKDNEYIRGAFQMKKDGAFEEIYYYRASGVLRTDKTYPNYLLNLVSKEELMTRTSVQ